MEGYPLDLGIWKDFLNSTQIVLTIKEKINKLD